MSLGRKGYPSDSARFLDDLDLNLIVDPRVDAEQQSLRVEVVSQPVILRASYRDIHLISVILNRAIELSANSSNPPDATAPHKVNENRVTPQSLPARNQDNIPDLTPQRSSISGAKSVEEKVGNFSNTKRKSLLS